LVALLKYQIIDSELGWINRINTFVSAQGEFGKYYPTGARRAVSDIRRKGACRSYAFFQQQVKYQH